ncbi:hypothetical protein COU61_00805 [Candidatus Pacearchaeota archaeon CG10_big_fil_rev_8_21_14_0_10_35_13]|nr:MAG: hypothetical protein COU61_00805 [Candidatus Pacearchaeota archaeon CG10_big_fil_rev_8_21_14_0_10_35_13]
MPRPRGRRRIRGMPRADYYKPAGIPVREIEVVVITGEEFEALRLKDKEGLEQNECAEKMQVSQPTFHRIITTARKKVSEAIIEGKALRIDRESF